MLQATHLKPLKQIALQHRLHRKGSRIYMTCKVIIHVSIPQRGEPGHSAINCTGPPLFQDAIKRLQTLP